MKCNILIAVCAVIGVTTAETLHAAEFTEYLGKIPVASGAAPVAAGPSGQLFYATLRAATSEVRVIENPAAEIGSAATNVGTVIAAYPLTSTRGFQGLSVSNSGVLFAAADNAGGSSYLGSLFKFNPVVSGATTTYQEDTAFRSNIETNNAGRRSGVAVVSEAGSGLVAASGFSTGSTIDYFDFSGSRVGSQLTEPLLYYRELQYNTVNKLIYPLRAGKSNNDMLRSYVDNVDPVIGGGVITQKILIDDGANNPGTVSPIQNGFYYAAEHQLITCDQLATTSTEFTGSRHQVRVWDIIENGTSLTLA